MADLVAELYDQELRNHAKGRLLDLGWRICAALSSLQRTTLQRIFVSIGLTRYMQMSTWDLVCDLSKDLPFKDQEFDTIILSDVFGAHPQS